MYRESIFPTGPCSGYFKAGRLNLNGVVQFGYFGNSLLTLIKIETEKT